MRFSRQYISPWCLHVEVGKLLGKTPFLLGIAPTPLHPSLTFNLNEVLIVHKNAVYDAKRNCPSGPQI